MRLLFVTQDFPPAIGGIQTYSWELARRLSRWTEQLRVIAPTAKQENSVSGAEEFQVTRLPARPDLLVLPALAHIPVWAARHQPDVAFHAQWQTVAASALARAVTGWPRHIVCAAHGRELLFNPADDYPALGTLYDTLRRLALRTVDHFVPVSRYTAGLLHDQNIPSTRTHVLPNGTNPARFTPENGTRIREQLDCLEQPMLLTVGRLVPRKGIDTVLRALPNVLQSVPDLTYVVVGTGPDRARLEGVADECDVREHVHFAGSVPHEELPSVYSAADIFVMPAREAPPDVEGFGIVFLEANACETPVIGARSGGIPDAIVDEETGLLVPPADPTALTDALVQLLEEPQIAETLGAQGRERVLREASWDRVAEQLFERLSMLT